MIALHGIASSYMVSSFSSPRARVFQAVVCLLVSSSGGDLFSGPYPAQVAVFEFVLTAELVSLLNESALSSVFTAA